MLYPLLRPLIFRLDAECAHRLSILALQLGSVAPPPPEGPLATTVAGIRFPNPLGMAPGFDKDAQVPDAVLGLGFGSVEIGTVTPRPQAGNPRPRLFRLEEDRAVINRMGFNNGGLQAALLRLSSRHRRGVVGVNVGANKDAADRVADYVTGLSTMAPVADYLTINISSPNTPGLRDMQGDKELEDLLSAVAAARESHWPPRSDTGEGPQPSRPPIFLKVAPDLDDEAPARIVAAVMKHGIDGIIVSNTTITRPPLQSRHADEAGGLSGAPLHDLALQRLRDFRKASEGRLPLIGVGGIASAEQAWARIRAGASLVQLYSAMVYEGPGIARAILPRLEALMRRDGFSSIAEAVGSE